MQSYFGFNGEGHLMGLGKFLDINEAIAASPLEVVRVVDGPYLLDLACIVDQLTPQIMDEMNSRLSEALSAKLGGAVTCLWDDDPSPFSCSGSRLPAHPDLAHVYPKGWSFSQSYSLLQAIAILEEKL